MEIIIRKDTHVETLERNQFEINENLPDWMDAVVTHTQQQHGSIKIDDEVVYEVEGDDLRWRDDKGLDRIVDEDITEAFIKFNKIIGRNSVQE